MENIINPYSKDQLPVGSIHFPMREETFNEGVEAAIQAMKPKKFGDELPEHDQTILAFSSALIPQYVYSFKAENLRSDGDNSFYVVDGRYYTHWIPKITLD